MPLRYRRFYDLSLSERILNTAFLTTIGLGYLFALVNLYYSHQSRDGIPGLSIQDIAAAYHGSQNRTRLEAAVTGIMEPNLKFKSDKDVILKWIQNGAGAEEYEGKVQPILQRDCVICHNPTANPNLPNLTTYAGAEAVAHGTPASIPNLVRVSHIHLFGIAFILYFIGRIFLLCDIHVGLKRVAVAVPFIAIVLDVISWYVTRFFPGFAYIVVFAGALMGLSIAFQIVLSLFQMWSHRVHPVNRKHSLQLREVRCKALLEEFGHMTRKEGESWCVTAPNGSKHQAETLEALERYARHLELIYQQSD